MPSFKMITGIVLRHIPYGEAEKLFIFITPTGKRKAFAKGVRKVTSKSAAHLELFTHANVQLVDGHSDRSIITSAVSLNRFDELASDIEKYALAMFACEMIDLFAMENDDTGYNVLLDLLMFLKKKQYTKNFALMLLNKICTVAGCTPSVELCASCGSETVPEDLWYSYQEGGIVCSQCRRDCECETIDLFAVKILRNIFRHNNLPMAYDIPLPKVRQVSEILFKQLTFHADVKSKTWTMVKDVVLK